MVSLIEGSSRTGEHLEDGSDVRSFQSVPVSRFSSEPLVTQIIEHEAQEEDNRWTSRKVTLKMEVL